MEKMLEDGEPKDGASVLSASQAFQDFALRYAENHLNESGMMQIMKKKLGKLLDWFSYFHCTLDDG